MPSPILVQQWRAGGQKTALNLTAQGAISTVPGVLYRLIPIAAGSAGSWVILDINFQGAYVATQTYTVGQAVSSGGNVYFALQNTTGNAPTGGAPNWTAANTLPTANPTIYSAAYNAAGIVLGNSIVLEAPVVNGIFLYTVPSAGSPIMNVTYS